MNILFTTTKSLIQKLSIRKIPVRLLFITTGIVSTIWFLIRFIPKPQRAGYPCMRAAAPIMSGFIIYILSLGGLAFLFKKSVANFKKAKYWSSLAAFLLCIVLFAAFNLKDSIPAWASASATLGVLPDAPNSPMGEPRGLKPGRVVWCWNPDATDKTCPNTITDAFFMASNNNQDTINKMADNSIKGLSGKATVSEAWDAIFKDFNLRKKGSATGYQSGQTFFIKVNNGTAGWAIKQSTLAETGITSSTGVANAAMAGTTPATVVAIIRQLVESCGVPQNKIYVGESMTHVYKSMYDAIHTKYPYVKIMDRVDRTDVGRTTSSGWSNETIVYSDQGSVMPDAISDTIMNEMYDADYLINIAALKAHARNGVSLCAKLHFGSHSRSGASHLHDGLICTAGNDNLTDGVRDTYGVYRVMVDLMGNEKLGGNTVLFIVDGLWGGIEATDMPVKWKIAPFNNDFPSSLFISQDEVALESVCIDFLRAEATVNTAFNNRPLFPAVDDYLHQAADPANWPSDITYDPEGDGTPLTSLGIHEHWNNTTDKQYTRNLEISGGGIDLYSIPSSLVKYNYSTTSLTNNQISTAELLAYPNPCSDETNISFQVKLNAMVSISLVSMDGRVIRNIKEEQMTAGNYSNKINTSELKSGLYFCIIKAKSLGNTDIQTVKIEIR